MKRGPEFVCVIEFGGTERTVNAVVSVGALARLNLPVPMTWPDGSQTDYLDVLIEEMPNERDSRASALPTAK